MRGWSFVHTAEAFKILHIMLGDTEGYFVKKTLCLIQIYVSVCQRFELAYKLMREPISCDTQLKELRKHTHMQATRNLDVNCLTDSKLVSLLGREPITYPLKKLICISFASLSIINSLRISQRRKVNWLKITVFSFDHLKSFNFICQSYLFSLNLKFMFSLDGVNDNWKAVHSTNSVCVRIVLCNSISTNGLSINFFILVVISSHIIFFFILCFRKYCCFTIKCFFLSLSYLSPFCAYLRCHFQCSLILKDVVCNLVVSPSISIPNQIELSHYTLPIHSSVHIVLYHSKYSNTHRMNGMIVQEAASRQLNPALSLLK